MLVFTDMVFKGRPDGRQRPCPLLLWTERVIKRSADAVGQSIAATLEERLARGSCAD